MHRRGTGLDYSFTLAILISIEQICLTGEGAGTNPPIFRADTDYRGDTVQAVALTFEG
jgi:hypothetical protein